MADPIRRVAGAPTRELSAQPWIPPSTTLPTWMESPAGTRRCLRSPRRATDGHHAYRPRWSAVRSANERAVTPPPLGRCHVGHDHLARPECDIWRAHRVGRPGIGPVTGSVCSGRPSFYRPTVDADAVSVIPDIRRDPLGALSWTQPTTLNEVVRLLSSQAVARGGGSRSGPAGEEGRLFARHVAALPGLVAVLGPQMRRWTSWGASVAR